MSTQDILLELGTEEIPAGFIDDLLLQMERFSAKWFGERNISFATARTMGTPRRLTLILKGVAVSGHATTQELLGPARNIAFDANGQLTRAGEGFLRSKGFAASDAYVKETSKGEYLAVMQRQEAVQTMAVLPQFFEELIRSLSCRKSMQWGSGTFRFARPLRHIAAFFGTQAVDFAMEGLRSGGTTSGHRFLGSREIALQGASSYQTQLEAQQVIVDISRRRAMIQEACDAVAKQHGGRVIGGESLVNLTSHLVEYPVAVVGDFDERFLRLPRELLIVTMREHQKYFALEDAGGRLLPHFITISNMPIDDTSSIKRGNERVLRARLSDAEFYYDEDLKTPLASRKAQLDKVVFQEQLGSIGQKVERIAGIADALAQAAGLSESQRADIATLALLSKCDLVSGMVYEFPELQGVMGKEYAAQEGYSETVSRGIMEHWFPRHAGDTLPSSMEAAMVSIADKMDTIAGCFGIGLLPSSSNDPYALRRQALGILHTLSHWKLSVSLDAVIHMALQRLAKVISRESRQVAEEIANFIIQRSKVFFTTTEGFDHDVVESVFSGRFSDVITVSRKLQALQSLKSRQDYRSVVETFRRAVNIIPEGFSGSVNAALFQHASEGELLGRLDAVLPQALDCVKKNDFDGVFGIALQLKPHVDKLFDNVMVMDKDVAVRNNRLALLQQVGQLFAGVADFSKLVVE